MEQVVESFLMENKAQFILFSQYHSCWWHGGEETQGISSHGVDLVLEYSCLAARGVNVNFENWKTGHWWSIIDSNGNIRKVFPCILSFTYKPLSQIPQCIRQMTYNAPLCNRNVHISVTKWCIVGYGAGALWDLYWSLCLPVTVPQHQLGFSKVVVTTKNMHVFFHDFFGYQWSSAKILIRSNDTK